MAVTFAGSDFVGRRSDFAPVARKQIDFVRTSGEPAMPFTRITVSADQMGGVPCIRGLRIPVATVLGMLADGMRDEDILRHYPDLEPDDICEALRYASEAVRERELPLRRAE